MQWQFVTFIKVSVSNYYDLISFQNNQRKCLHKIIQRTEKTQPLHKAFFSSAVNYLNWLSLSANVAQCCHLTPTALQMCPGTFQECSTTAFMLDITSKHRILILKISENLFVVIPTDFESDLKQTINALRFPFYPKSRGPLWVPGLTYKFFKIAKMV